MTKSQGFVEKALKGSRKRVNAILDDATKSLAEQAVAPDRAAIRSATKLARAEAKAEYWQEQANRLAVQLAEANCTIEAAQREVVDVQAYNRSQLERSEQTAKQWKGEAEKAKDENNGLRTIIRDLELTVERHRGFQDGVREAQPPRMVPEERPSVRNDWPYPQSEIVDPLGVIGSRHPHTKPWWHK